METVTGKMFTHRLRKVLVALAVTMTGASPITVALAAPGDLIATVTLPGNSTCNVGLAFDGTYVMAIDDGNCAGSQIGIYTPPAGNGAATLVATKTVKDATGNPVAISAIDWDPTRGMLWGGLANDVYLIDIGDPTVSGDALATFQFNPNVGGIGLTDGIAWDANDDTLYYSPDVDLNVYQFSLGTGGNPPLGTLMNTVTPKDANGVADGDVSGVAIGAGNSLYIGRNGNAEIRRVDKSTGDFISTFATTAGRVEDLLCDPVTYAPNEAILAKDAYSSLYEAFEVEPGTCPLAGSEPVEGRMTGGGSVFTTAGMRVTHGFALHCDAADVPNKLQVNWGKGQRFHLDSLTRATCFDDANIEPNPPVAGFDTYKGEGTGHYNGQDGATIEFLFTDAGEPGSNDTASIKIWDAGGDLVLEVTNTLHSGNQQAHLD